MELRPLGRSGLQVTPVALGCWPISGMTSLDVNDADSLATIRAARERGINFFDTAYCYGAKGESERLLARALGGERDQVVLATKGGLHWDEQGTRITDGSPDRLRQQCEESLRRLQFDHLDLLYLHMPDPRVPIEDSAGALRELLEAGKTRAVGASNVSLEQLRAFHAVCPVSAVQLPYNLLQREIEADIVPWCVEHEVAIVPYWPLLKGLLAGKLSRDHHFPQADGRHKYADFQGERYQRNLEYVDHLRSIAAECGRSVAQLAVHWTITQPGITSALCGAKRPQQIEETAGAVGWELTRDQRARAQTQLA
jgi:aryl-alcohol dehydrogenase-like predicted oxidoreductase